MKVTLEQIGGAGYSPRHGTCRNWRVLLDGEHIGEVGNNARGGFWLRGADGRTFREGGFPVLGLTARDAAEKLAKLLND